MACTASVCDKNRYDPEIRGMSYRRLDADLQRDAADRESRDPAVAQSELPNSGWEAAEGWCAAAARGLCLVATDRT
jgi:hypothetical protein